MADMMKNIIEEVLYKGEKQKQPQTDPLAGIGIQGRASKQAAGIPNISRPNYQRQKQQNRLGSIAAPSSSSPQVRPGNQGSQRVVSVQTDAPVEQRLSALHRLAISQVTQRGVAGYRGSTPAEEPRLIGKTRSEEYVWFYPSVSSMLGQLLNKQNRVGCSAGIINREQAGDGLVFLMEEWLKLLPDASYEILPYAVQVFSNDRERMKQFLEDAYRDLNRRSIQTKKIYKVEQPSRFLQQHLNISDGVSVALVEDISYFNSIALLERCFAKFSDMPISYDIRENEFVITGQPSIVDSAVQQIKQDIEQLLV